MSVDMISASSNAVVVVVAQILSILSSHHASVSCISFQFDTFGPPAASPRLECLPDFCHLHLLSLPFPLSLATSGTVTGADLALPLPLPANLLNLNQHSSDE